MKYILLLLTLLLSANANEILKKCDFNKNGYIDDPRKHYGIKTRAEMRNLSAEVREIIGKENMCVRDYEIAQNKAKIAQNKAIIAQNKAKIAKIEESTEKLKKIKQLLEGK